MDDADRAAKFQAEQIERGLRNVGRERMPYTGSCYWCDAPVGPKAKFCLGGECRDDYEKDKDREKDRRRQR